MVEQKCTFGLYCIPHDEDCMHKRTKIKVNWFLFTVERTNVPSALFHRACTRSNMASRTLNNVTTKGRM